VSGKEQLGKLVPFLADLFLGGSIPNVPIVTNVAPRRGPFAPPEPTPPPAAAETAASSEPCVRCEGVGEVVVRTTGGETVVAKCPKCRPSAAGK
jgi:hypothetical protein